MNSNMEQYFSISINNVIEFFDIVKELTINYQIDCIHRDTKVNHNEIAVIINQIMMIKSVSISN